MSENEWVGSGGAVMLTLLRDEQEVLYDTILNEFPGLCRSRLVSLLSVGKWQNLRSQALQLVTRTRG